jgi:type I restriction enzyme S subunit
VTWPLVSISSVAEVNPRLPKEIDENQQVSFIGMASVSEDGLLLSEENRVLAETKKGFTYFSKEDVLLAKITPCFENGKCLRPGLISNDIGYGSTEFHVIRSKQGTLDATYLFYMLWSNHFRFYGKNSMFGAVGQQRVSADFIRNYLIPLPYPEDPEKSLKEQKRIAAILDKADGIRRKRKQAIQLADDFLRSVFLDMFGDPVTNPKGWEVKTFRDLIREWKPGVTIQPDDFTETGFPVLHKGAVQRGGNLKFDSRKKTHTSLEFAEGNSKAVIDESYIAVNLRDLVPSGPSIGLMCDLSRYGSKKYLLAYGAYGFKVNYEAVSPEYLVALTNHSGFRNKLIRISVGSTQIHIRKDDFFDLNIPFPDQKIQNKYQLIVEKTRASLSKSMDAFGRVDLFSSLSQKAFKGEL